MDATGAEVIRLGENAIYRLPGGVIARVARAGQNAAATKEVQVGRHKLILNTLRPSSATAST
ncbi:hypothetical protein ALI22I_24915 [Saccharothrix sp. ALI-22-I]|nr:hypothetical protein ALI22I_24915 [Saccharothrix sp. ALI-22-I]